LQVYRIMALENSISKQTPFQSPVPFLRQLSKFTFGTREPDHFTKLTFYLLLFYWFCFFVWSVASYLTISFREFIMSEKKIPVEEIINARGLALGFQESEFLEHLLTAHGIGMVCWLVVLVGLILLWRKQESYLWFILLPVLFYLGLLLFYMSPAYFREDVTFFDKSGLVIVLAATLMHFLMLKRERTGGSINLFEEDAE
jgi:hypothetical protein